MKKTYLILAVFSFISLMFMSSPSKSEAWSTRSAELEHADKELNRVYNLIINKMDSETQQHLREAQRKWIEFRDLDCTWAFVDNRDCLMDRTERRAEELRNSWFYDSSKKYISLD